MEEVLIVDCALVITWKVPFPGRERHALQLAAEADEHWGRFAAEGRCTTPEWYFCPNGVGMWIVKGERRVIEDLVDGDGSRRLLEKGMLYLQDWQWTLAETGSGAQRFMSEYADELAHI